MAKSANPPRLSIQISEEQNQALWRLIPWGVKNELFRVIVDDLIDLLEDHGEQVLVAILAKKLRLKDYSQIGGKDGKTS